MSASTYNILITGANRGLGRALLSTYLLRAQTLVVAGVRSPSQATSKALSSLPTGPGSRLLLLELDSSQPSPVLASKLAELQLSHLDLVIANAGIAHSFGPIASADIDVLAQHMDVNVYGPIRLYQAVAPLLHKAAAPKWVAMGSVAGSLSEMVPVPNVAYGLSKTGLHFVTKKINMEDKALAALVVHPGWVQTDLGNAGARSAGLEKAPQTIEEVCPAIVKIIDQATRETHGGRLWWYDGTEHTWEMNSRYLQPRAPVLESRQRFLMVDETMQLVD